MRGVRLAFAALPYLLAPAYAAPKGANLFVAHCTPCHGAEGRGDGPEARNFDPPPRNLRGEWLRKASLDELVARVRHGVPLSLQADPQRRDDHADEVEAVVGHLRRLPTTDWRRVERGEEAWVDRCELCHGPIGRPPRRAPVGVKRPPDLSDGHRLRALTAENLTRLVRHGRRGMPALVPRLSTDDIQALTAYVERLSSGLQIYTRYCAGCHGEDGHPGDDVVEGVRRPGVNFDAAYFAAHDDDYLRLRVWHMVSERKPAMPHLGRSVSDAEARAILEYLRALP